MPPYFIECSKVTHPGHCGDLVKNIEHIKMQAEIRLNTENLHLHNVRGSKNGDRSSLT